MDKIVIVIGALLLAWGLAACGTIEIDVANENQEADDVADSVDSGTANPENASPATTATRTAEVEARATPSRSAEAQEADPTPRADVRVAPADWQRFYDDGYGIELWRPPGTIAMIGQPAKPVFSSVEFPEEIVEEQVFVVRVMQEEDGPSGPTGPQLILEVKLVANPEEENVAVLAERYSWRCPGGAPESPRPTTVSARLSGYRYGCEGIDGIIFNEFWAPHPADPQLLVGAVWADMSAPLADQILATVAFTD